MYALDSSTWEDLFADKTIGGYKYRYFRDSYQAEGYFKQAQEQFGNDNVSLLKTTGQFKGKVIIKNPSIDTKVEVNRKKAIAEKNYSEYKKEGAEVSGIKEVLDNFDKYYPSLEYMNRVEREAFVTALSQGELQQICGL